MPAWRTRFAGLALLVGPGILAAAGHERGRDLFTGVAPLRGTIIGHSSVLPSQSARCINCHALGGAASPVLAAASASFGPPLTRQHLTSAAARRGGPPSRYDQAALCRLLRQGLDPATVMIARAMPRYEISDPDCQALWLLLSDPKRP